MTSNWNPEQFKGLMDRAGLSRERMAEAINVSPVTVQSWMKARAKPSLDKAVEIADFLSVPLDVVIGRMDEEQYREIVEDYGAHYSDLRRGPYELYLKEAKHLAALPKGVVAPYPYNLLEEITGKPWEDPLSADQYDGLDRALDSLTGREQDAIEHYFHRGETMEDLTKVYGVTRERVRQILAKALRKLRHPTRLKLIEKGPILYARESTYQQALRDIEAKEAALKEREERLKGNFGELTPMRRCLTDLRGSMEELEKILSIGTENGYTGKETVDDMNLSVRSWNCLKRAGCNTLADVISLIQSGELYHVRNMGRRSAEEVIAKAEAMTGMALGVKGEST